MQAYVLPSRTIIVQTLIRSTFTPSATNRFMNKSQKKDSLSVGRLHRAPKDISPDFHLPRSHKRKLFTSQFFPSFDPFSERPKRERGVSRALVTNTPFNGKPL